MTDAITWMPHFLFPIDFVVLLLIKKILKWPKMLSDFQKLELSKIGKQAMITLRGMAAIPKNCSVWIGSSRRSLLLCLGKFFLNKVENSLTCWYILVCVAVKRKDWVVCEVADHPCFFSCKKFTIIYLGLIVTPTQ